MNEIIIEATISFSPKTNFASGNTLVLYPHLDVKQVCRCSKKEKAQRKGAAKKNRFPVPLQKELASIKKGDKLYNSKPRKTRQELKKEVENLVNESYVDGLLMQKEFEKAEYESGYKSGFDAGYYGDIFRLDTLESPVWNEGYSDGYDIGASERNWENDDDYGDDWDYDDWDYDDWYDDDYDDEDYDD